MFYNNTFYDDPINLVGEPAANVDDDGARSSKAAYLPGNGMTSFSNFSGFTRGINGIMMDLTAGGAHTLIDDSDFQFRIAPPLATNDPNGGNGNPVWADAAAPVTIAVRSSGTGLAAGSDRVTIIWADNAIKNTWLEVQVKATSHTGLPQSGAFGAGIADIFYFGNKAGDTGFGNEVDIAVTDSTDVVQNRVNQASDLGDVNNVWDMNKDDSVDAVDIISSRITANQVGELDMIDIASNPDAPATGSGSGDSGVASALAALAGGSSNSAPSLPGWLVARLHDVNLTNGPIVDAIHRSEEQQTPQPHETIVAADRVIEALEADPSLDDERPAWDSVYKNL